MILVAGGTGRLGSQVVGGLLTRGHQVRVLARGKRSRPAEIAGSDIVLGSVTDAAAVQRAVDGVNLVVSAITGFPFTAPARVDSAGNALLVEAAQSVGAEVVLLSVAGAAADSAMELFRAKAAAEQALSRSTARGTIIRPEAFADLWIELLTTTAGRSHRPLVFGRGDTPFGWVAVGDVAALVIRVIEDPSLRGSTLTVSGPERISLNDLARRVMAAHGWPGNPRHVPVVALRVAARLPGRAGRQAQAGLAMDSLPPVIDNAHEAVPDLPRTRVGDLLATLPLIRADRMDTPTAPPPHSDQVPRTDP
jgi:uncharacterized protein YbjT (DUF2867 family)